MSLSKEFMDESGEGSKPTPKEIARGRTVLTERPQIPRAPKEWTPQEQREATARSEAQAQALMGELMAGAIQKHEPEAGEVIHPTQTATRHLEQNRQEATVAQPEAKIDSESQLEDLIKDVDPSLNPRVENINGRQVITVGPEENRAILDPSLKSGEIVMSGRAPIIPERLDNAGLSEYINQQILILEGNPASLDLGIVQDLVNTITGYRGQLADEAKLKEGLILKLKARLELSLAEYLAIEPNLENYSQLITDLGTLKRKNAAGFEEFTNALEQITIDGEYNEQIRYCIRELENGDGAHYIKDRTGQEDDYRIIIEDPGGLIEQIMAAPLPAWKTTPWLRDEAKEQAILLLTLSKRVLNVYGEETRYSGPRERTSGDLIEAKILKKVFTDKHRRIDLTEEEYWQEWTKERQNWRQNWETTASTDPSNTRGVETPKTFGNAPTMFRNIFWTPERAEQLGWGKASKLYYAMESRGRSFALFKGESSLTNVIENTKKQRRSPGTRVEGAIGSRDHSYWSGIIKAAGETAGKFYRSEPFLLYNPLQDPNSARSDPNKAIAALEGVRKISFAHAGWYGGKYMAEAQFQAQADLVKAVFNYLDTDEASKEFKYLKWHSNEKSAALRDLLRSSYITTNEIEDIRKQPGKEITALSAFSQAFAQESFPDFFKALKALLSFITRIER